MTQTPNISRLEMVDLRQAWAHEALGFTPWLCENLDQLSEAVGIPLEREGSEVAVASFSADILARNTMDDTRVLIENQLECSDHTHLGQILTYLAGLQARTIIWIAREFREPHLAAVKWLNEHTAEEFAFFAVQLRVARIADSPLAPIFDVIERPNNWERQTQAAAVRREYSSGVSGDRLAFWTAYLAATPGDRERSGEPKASSNRWRVLPGQGLIISFYVAAEGVGLFVRGMRGSDGQGVRERLLPFASVLEAQLSAPLGDGSEHFFGSFCEGNYRDPAEHPRLIAWLSERVERYESVLLNVFGQESMSTNHR